MLMYDDMCSGAQVGEPHRRTWNFICMTGLTKLYLLNYKEQKLSSQFFILGGLKSAPIIGNTDNRVSDNRKPPVVGSY